NTYTTIFVIQLVLFAILPFTTNAIIFKVILAVIYTCYGGGFASIPAYIGDMFGRRQIGAIHGSVLSAWSSAGVAGPMHPAWRKDTTVSYESSLLFFAVLFVVALIISLLIRVDIKRLRNEKEGIVAVEPAIAATK